MTFEYYKDSAGEWRWRLVVEGNREILAVSSEGYKEKRDMLAAIHRIQTDAAVTPYAEIKAP